MRFANMVLSTVAVLGMAACSHESTSDRMASGSVDPTVTQTTEQFRGGDISTLTSRGPIPVAVQGSAFGLDRASLETTIANDMQGANWGPDARFVPASQLQAADLGSREYSVVILLNGPTRVNSRQLCSTGLGQSGSGALFSPSTPPSQTAAPNGGRRDVELLGALCRNGQNVRQVKSGADNISGPNDPAFHNLIVKATNELTSPTGGRDPQQGSQQDD